MAHRLAELWRRGLERGVRTIAWVRRAPAWLVAMLWLVAGLTVGGVLVSSLLSQPIFGTDRSFLSASGGRVAPIGEAAVIIGPLVDVHQGVIQLVWRVTNVGDRTWHADTHRFNPGARDLPVIALPRTVPPRETVTLLVRLTLSSDQEVRDLTWQLTGPSGEVTGGELIARVDLAGN